MWSPHYSCIWNNPNTPVTNFCRSQQSKLHQLEGSESLCDSKENQCVHLSGAHGGHVQNPFHSVMEANTRVWRTPEPRILHMHGCKHAAASLQTRFKRRREASKIKGTFFKTPSGSINGPALQIKAPENHNSETQRARLQLLAGVKHLDQRGGGEQEFIFKCDRLCVD